MIDTTRQWKRTVDAAGLAGVLALSGVAFFAGYRPLAARIEDSRNAELEVVRVREQLNAAANLLDTTSARLASNLDLCLSSTETRLNAACTGLSEADTDSVMDKNSITAAFFDLAGIGFLFRVLLRIAFIDNPALAEICNPKRSD